MRKCFLSPFLFIRVYLQLENNQVSGLSLARSSTNFVLSNPNCRSSSPAHNILLAVSFPFYGH